MFKLNLIILKLLTFFNISIFISRCRFCDAIEELRSFLEEDGLKTVPLLVLANKQDLPGALFPEAVEEKIKEVPNIHRAWSVFGVSASHKVSGLQAAFDWLASAIVDREVEHIVSRWSSETPAEDVKNDDTSRENPNGKKVCGMMESHKKLLYRFI